MSAKQTDAVAAALAAGNEDADAVAAAKAKAAAEAKEAKEAEAAAKVAKAKADKEAKEAEVAAAALAEAQAKAASTFKLYDATVRIGGNLLNEVQVYGVTAPEVMVLRTIHGSSGVENVKATGASADEEVTSRTERSRLHAKYGQGPAKQNLLKDIFGPGHVQLPLEYDENFIPDSEMGAEG